MAGWLVGEGNLPCIITHQLNYKDVTYWALIKPNLSRFTFLFSLNLIK